MLYKHDKWIRLWLDGVPLQYLQEGIWRDMPGRDVATKTPHFYVASEYRRKPVTTRYRTARVGRQLLTAQNLQEATEIERAVAFAGWIDEWKEVTEC